jgi:hypothetical protein
MTKYAKYKKQVKKAPALLVVALISQELSTLPVPDSFIASS